jgi:uncharacterized protein (UPF0248 family)
MAKKILDLMLWSPERDILNCEITYIPPKSEGKLTTINGSEIKKLYRGFLILKEDIEVPYQNIVKIDCKNNLIWKKHKGKV